MGEDAPKGERIAKRLSRAGHASRRQAERMIAEGRVSVNGDVIDTPATLVVPEDRIEVDGAPLAPPEAPRLWLYHKPAGLVTTEADEKGRKTVFDALPDDLPRVMSVGRLDLNSEGLLLLTNDGTLKRRLELPSTGWMRRYRVRVNGRPDARMLRPLEEGIEVEGERFRPMQVALDRQQGANAWLTVGLREGKNREIRRAMETVGLAVNRLIRISYGPFQLGNLEAGEVQEVKGRVLADQLGPNAGPDGERDEPPRREGGPRRGGPGGGPRPEGGGRSFGGKGGGPARRTQDDGPGKRGGGGRPFGKGGGPGGGQGGWRRDDGPRPARGDGAKDTRPGGGKGPGRGGAKGAPHGAGRPPRPAGDGPKPGRPPRDGGPGRGPGGGRPPRGGPKGRG